MGCGSAVWPHIVWQPARQRSPRGPIEPGRGVGERVEPERLAHLPIESGCARRGILPLGRTMLLQLRWWVLVGLEVVGLMSPSLELGECAHGEALQNALLDGR